jgi:REP element-mobilizing transposase RayT
MSRPLRLEFEGAFWHVTSRGNERKDIFREDRDRLLFLSLLAAAVKRFRWRLHEYCLMTNHYHLVIETPFRTLAKGMHWLNSEYVRIFNKRYERVGHLFQGRYKGILVDEQNYLDEVRRYTVLNPVRAGMIADPAEYRWSSYRAHAGLELIPEWLYSEWLFDLHTERPKCHEMYRDYVTAKIGSTESIWEKLVGQIYLGSAEWIEKMRKVVAEKPRSDEHAMTQRLIPRLKMATVVKAVAKTCGIDDRDLRHRHGGFPRMLAAWIAWNEGLLRLREIAAALRLRSSGYISTLVRRGDRELAGDDVLRGLARQAIATLQLA